MNREDFIAIAAVVLGIALAVIYSWREEARRISRLQPEGTKTSDIPRKLPLREYLTFLMAPLVVLGVAVGLGRVFGWSFVASIALVLVPGIAILVLLAWRFQRRRMRYSPEGARVLALLVEELRPQFLAGHHGVLEIVGAYFFDYPKVEVLFESDQALEEAKTGGLLARLADKITETVRGDSAFGRNRESFDPNQAVHATTSRQYWDAVHSRKPA